MRALEFPSTARVGLTSSVVLALLLSNLSHAIGMFFFNHHSLPILISYWAWSQGSHSFERGLSYYMG